MKSNRFPKIYRLGVLYPKTVLFLALLASVLAFLGAKKLQVETNLLTLLPQETESVAALNEQNKYFGGTSFVVVAVEEKDPVLNRQFADVFAQKLEALPSVLYVDYKRPVEFFKKRQWYYLDKQDLAEMELRIDRSLALEKKGASPIYSELMDFADEEDRPDLTFSDIRKKYENKAGVQPKEETSDQEGKFIVLRVKPKEAAENLDSNKKVMEEIQRTEQEVRKTTGLSSVKVGYTGGYQSSIEEQEMVGKQIHYVSTLVAIILLLILLFYFKRFSAVFLVACPLALGILWSGGLVYLLLGHLNLISAFCAAILAGLGSDYGIYLLSRYYHERDQGHDFQKACELAFSNTGLATYLSMLTTVGAFLALIFSKFGVFREFGIVGAVGVFLNYLSMMWVMPSLLTLTLPWARKFTEKGWNLQKCLPPQFEFDFWPRVVHWFYPRKGVQFGIVIFILLVLASVFSIPKESEIYFEDGQMDTSELPANQLYSRVSAVSQMPLSPTILIAKNLEEERKIIQTIEENVQNKDPKDLVYNRVLGITRFLPTHLDEKREILQRIENKFPLVKAGIKKKKEAFLESVKQTLQVSSISLADIPKEVIRIFESYNTPGIYSIYLYPSMVRADSESMDRYHRGIQNLKAQVGIDFVAADGNLVQDDTVKMIKKESPRVLFFVLLFLGLVLIIWLKPFREALLTFTYLFASLILLSGVLWLCKIKLNVMNIVVIPVVLGTGIDAFIHYYIHYYETGDMKETFETRIPAIIVSNLTTIVGFGGSS